MTFLDACVAPVSLELCGAVDDVTGCGCTKKEHLDLRHSDDSDPGCILMWTTPLNPMLLVMPGD